MPKPPKGKKLTDKQARFVQEYLVDLNATQAAIRAGYCERAAYAMGAENLTKPVIAEAIAKKQEKLQKKTEITIERVLQEYARVALLDPTKIWENGRIKEIHEMDEDTRRAIAGIEVTTGGNAKIPEILKKIKLWDKVKALDSLGKHLGMFVDRKELSGPGGQPVQFVFVEDQDELD